MSRLRSHSARIYSKNDRSLAHTDGEIIEVLWNRKERIRNAIRTILTWFGVMCASALIPFWHYLLVPGLFVASWVFGIEKLREDHRCDGGTGACPKCLKTVRIGKSSWKETLTETCESCFQDLEIRIQTADQ
jgi:hypothetical protein